MDGATTFTIKAKVQHFCYTKCQLFTVIRGVVMVIVVAPLCGLYYKGFAIVMTM
jgi:hypothetical protein